MLSVVRAYRELNMDALMQIYEQSNMEQGAEADRSLSGNACLLRGEQLLRDYLRSTFFLDNAAFIALWSAGGRPVSVLRVESYHDGLILTGLETAPEARGKGYAKALVNAVIRYLMDSAYTVLYSHVRKDNSISMSVHKDCGFVKIKDHAVYLDGSVSCDAVTLMCQIRKPH